MNHQHQELFETIENCKKGNRRAQKVVYEMFFGKMLSVCMRYASNQAQAEDIMQDAMLKVFAKITSYNHQGSFEGWIRRIVVNTAIDYFRRSRKDFILLGENQSVEDYAEMADEEEEEHEVAFSPKEILDAMHQLTPAYRTIFNLYVFENMSHKDIAEQVGISVGTSKSNLAKARKNVKNILLKATSK